MKRFPIGGCALLLGAFTVISASSANTLKFSRSRLPEPAVTAAPAPAQTAEWGGVIA